MAPKPTALPSPPNATKPTGPGGFMDAAWLQYFNRTVQFIATLTQRGDRASQPPATAVYPGTLYFVTDELVTERSNGEIWETFSA